MNIIDLKNYLQKDEKILSGRDYGESVRNNINLKKYDTANQKVNIVIPNNVTINISFFLGLFGPSIRQLGEDGFRENYSFTCSDRGMELINRGIKQALKKSSVLVG